MTTSVQAWHDLLGDSSMEGVEEGFLDETDNATLKVHETSTAFPRPAKHGWQELVSDPSLSEAEISENRKKQGNNAQAEIGCKDWDHYLSTFSLNDDDPTKFTALEIHTEKGGKDFGSSDASDVRKHEKNSFNVGHKSIADVMDGMETKTLSMISGTDGQKNIVETQGGLNQALGSSSLDSFPVSEHVSFPATSKSKQSLPAAKFPQHTKNYDPPDGENLYETSKTSVSSGPPTTGFDNEMNFQSEIMPGTNMLPESSTAHIQEKTSELIRRPYSVPLQTSEGQPLLHIGKRSPPISNANSQWQTEIRPSSAPARETKEMQAPMEGSNMLPIDANNVSSVKFKSSTNFPLTNSGRSGMKTSQARSQSALDVYGNNYFPKQLSSVPRANSAPLWGNTDRPMSLDPVTTALPHFQNEKVPTQSDQAGHVRANGTTKMDDWESSLEQRKISGADEDMLHKVRSGAQRNSDDKTLREAKESFLGNVSNGTTSIETSYSRASRPNSRLATGMDGKERTDGKKTVPFEDLPHPSGDGMHGTKSEDNISEDFVLSRGLKVTNISDMEGKSSLENGNQHFIAEDVHDAIGTKEEQDSPLLVDLELNTDLVSSNTHHIFTMERPDQTECTSEDPNVASFRETAENLPVRPLTIGNSLTIGSTLAYRPISPFQPDLYPSGAAMPVSMVPSTTSVPTVPTTHLSASQYSEGALEEDEEREGDMSARERLQPLGRDGLEVKQGPPWGITMPLFQPNSRDSSLSSSDSSGSNAQIVQLQTTSNQQLKPETEPLQSISSISSETDLSRKASIKSLEPKEPMGVRMMKDAVNLKTPIRKFQQLNPSDGDSPVSKILGPTFKATQKMLEELQRRPLGAYDEVVGPPTMDNENTRNTQERRPSVERETVVTDKRTTSTTSIESREERSVKESGSTQDRRHSHSHVSSASWEEAGSYRDLSLNQETPDLIPMTTTNLGGVGGTPSSMVEDLQKVGDSKSSRGTTPSSADDLQNVASASRTVVDEFITNQETPNITSVTTTRHGVVTSDRNFVADGLQEVQVSRPFSKGKMQQSASESPAITTQNIVSTARSPLVSLKDGMSQRIVDNLVGSHFRRSEIHKTYQASELTDSTLASSVGLPGHLVSPQVGTYNEGNTQPEKRESENELESRHDASDMSEFDRVASESISWSNAVVNQFREEMKSVDLGIQEGFLDDMTLVNEPRTTTSILDSGLSESSSNDEMYRPKRLPRLPPSDESVGIYDVRRSSGPGSTNRKRLALGKKPRESSKTMLMGNIYVSDSATGTSDTDRDAHGRQSGQRIYGGVYVSEEASGAERVDNGIDSGPEGQSTPKSEDVSTRQSDVLAPGGFSPQGSNKSMTDMYLGVENSMFNKRTKSSRSSFSAYEIEKPTSAFTDYRPFRKDPPLYSTFETEKPLRAKPPATLRDGTPTREYANSQTNVLAEPQRDINVMRQKSAAKVEHTWSISKPVMSQLSSRTVPSVSHDISREPKSTTQHSLKQPTSHQPEHRHKREPRQKKSAPKTVPQHVQDQTTESSNSEKNGTIDKNGTTVRKKSVADIILENMIQDEQKQKKRHKKLEVKQEQTTQDLNLLWERFQDVFGKKSRSSRMSKRSHVARARPSRESTPTDISLASSSIISSSENRNIDRQSTYINTESDEEFERFLHRIREIQSSESSYQEDNRSMTSSTASSSQRVRHHQAESETTPSQRSQRKPRHTSVDSSTSMTSTVTSEDRRMRRNIPQEPAQERRPRKTARQTVDSPVIISSSVTGRDPEIPVSLPMWLSVKNKEIMKQEKVSTSACTCGAKSRKEKQKTLGVRDIGVNCPTPPIVAQEFQPVATDIAKLKAGPLEEIVSNPVSSPASLVKLSLQDAFMYSKQDFIERSRERVKKVKEKCEERRQEKTSSARVVVMVPSEKTKTRTEDKKPDEDKMHDMKSSKQFEQLQRKKPRPMTTKEIRDVNKRMYKNLPEVRKRRDEERRAQFYKTNRLRAQLYGKHVRNTNRIFTAA